VIDGSEANRLERGELEVDSFSSQTRRCEGRRKKKENGARIARGRSVTHDDDDDDEARLAALTLAIKLNAGLTFSCCVRLSYVDFCMAVE